MLNTVVKDKTIKVGDLIRVHQSFGDESKEKIQVFEGRVISIRGRGENKTFIVRKIAVNRIGVEKVYPVNLPSIVNIEVIKGMKTHRSKLYFLRDAKNRLTRKVL